jgi:hypothetical protein
VRVVLTVTIPGLRLVSEANAHEHWRKRHQRARGQKANVTMMLRAMFARPSFASPTPLVVTITRVAPRMLDSDNATGSAKHVRDGIAKWLGRDDSMTSGIEWVVRQAKGRPGEYRVEIRIETAEEARGSRREEVA